tara:strand:+ start:1689 stop:2471 length:783 start_codon:yes stop_codon:yes gene_type:complete
MKFNPIKIKINKKELIKYFVKHKIFSSDKKAKIHVHKKKNFIQKEAFGHELHDLYRLHQIILKYKRTTVLEFGVGWSTKIFANALLINKKRYLNKIKKLRLSNAFQVHSVDNYKRYISQTKMRLNNSEKKNTFIKFSNVRMCQYNGIISTEYEKLPRINPDLIYLDGPSQFNVKGTVNNISTAHNDFMPMACDILKIEYFLRPGTIIVIDGRTSNYQFLKNNFQRKWKTFEDYKNGQFFLILDEVPLGNLSSNQNEFYFK